MMNIENKTIEKRMYQSPEIQKIQLDNEISLALASNPAEGPNEGQTYNSPEYINQCPFNRNLV